MARNLLKFVRQPARWYTYDHVSTDTSMELQLVVGGLIWFQKLSITLLSGFGGAAKLGERVHARRMMVFMPTDSTR